MECDEMALMGGRNVWNRGSALYRYMECVTVGGGGGAGLRSGTTARSKVWNCACAALLTQRCSLDNMIAPGGGGTIVP